MLSADLLGHALDSAPDAIVITDASGTVVFANAQVTTLLGYDRAEIIGQNIERLLPERFRTRHVAHRLRYGEQPRVRPMGTGLDLYALRKDAIEVPVEISLSPIRAGGHGLIAAALRDATERRKTRSELIEARESADSANRAKSRFLATASHDLRQPLQTLALLNGALRRMIRDPDTADALAQQDQAIEAMSRLLNALLDIGKLESGAVHPDPSDFDIATLFEELRREFASHTQDKGLELRVVPTAASGYSDRTLVGQVLRNLLSNAAKYTTHGRVELRCTDGPQTVVIEVQDTGIGIAADQVGHIFEEFYQVGVGSNTAREGYGLGLSIVRRLVELLQLKLAVRSELGRGSTFSLELPRGVAAVRDGRSRPPAASVSGHAVTAPPVLLVDDDAGVRRATAMLLQVEGYRVLSASSLAEALTRVTDDPDVALLITDYHLRDETGLQVIEAVRAAVGRDLPAVVITGDTSSTVRELRKDDRVQLVSKPIDADRLLALLQSLLPR